MNSGSEEEDGSINIGTTIEQSLVLESVQDEDAAIDNDEDDTFSTEDNNDTKSNNNEDDDDESAESQYKLARCVPAIRKFLIERLTQIQSAVTISSYVNPYTIRNGHAESSNFHDSSWKVEITRRAGGLATGLLDFTYVHTAKDGKKSKLRGRAEALTFIGLLPPFKTIKNMTKDHCYINAEENRERHILSPLLSAHGFACDEVSYENGVMSIKKGSETFYSGLPVFDMFSSSTILVAAPVNSQDAFFAYGTSVILQWGKILADNPAFHTNSQLFPLGFRCIRMEHDVSLDRVVDCLCEIDGVYEKSETERTYYSTLFAAAKDDDERAALSTHDLVPLFRITVSWQIGPEPVAMTRVYEARSPQQAWQAAMLETLGLPAKMNGLPADDRMVSSPNAVDEMDDGATEESDAEEVQLRSQIREQRRSYFRALRTEQSLGLQAAVKPRLALEAVDTFAEDLVMRLIEGLPGSTLSENFVFTDLRDPLQAGRKNMMKYYTKAYMKAKALDKKIKNIKAPESQLKPTNSEVAEVDSELTTARIHMQRVRMSRIREIEKNLGLLRISLGKVTKKRREDAKAYVESICEKEESIMGAIASKVESGVYSTLSPAEVRTKADSGDLKCQQMIAEEMLQQHFSSARPEPSSCTLHHCGNVVGYILEVWEYLNAFAKALKVESIPSIDKLLAAVKVCDPTYRKLDELGLGFAHTSDGIEVSEFWPDEKHMPSIEEAEDILNEIGVELCGPLMKDFERIMGIEAMEAQIGQHRIPINSLTWKEIARVVLIETTSKLLGMNDIDIVGMVKGKGYATVLDAPDRKTIKLSRRRITYSYNIRNEFQESLYKFESGVCIRIPSPCNPTCIPKMLIDFWDPILSLLQGISEKNFWLSLKALKVSASALTVLDTSSKTRRLKKLFKRFIKVGNFRLRDTAEPQQALLAELLAYGTALERRNVDEKDSFHNWPSSTFELWAKQVHEAVRYARASNTVDRSEHVKSGSNSPKLSQGEAATIGDDADNDMLAGSESKISAPSESAHEEALLPMAHKDAQLLVDDDDAAEAEKLSVAMQRCYIVIRDLMNCSHSNMFIYPVSSEVVASYYKSVDKPISLSEIRKFLVEGGYENSIYRFYMDVRFLIENAVCFNPEGTLIRASAQKLLIIFERLFLESVLAWDSPHLYCDYCITCKALEHPSGCKMAVCDRCEALCHLDCMDPPLATPPRDWYCLLCVEQIGLASVHPLKTASVRHPDDPAKIGEVVGIEQPKQTLMFVVSFNGDREMWSGKKVRQYAIKAEYLQNPGSTSAEINIQDMLPSGYDIDDYDKVCGLARGYAGWGESHYVVPSVFMDAHSINASNLGKKSSAFNNNRLSIAALTCSGKSVSIECCNSMREWTMILYSLQQRALSSPAVTYILSQIEEGVDEKLTNQLTEEIRSGCLSAKSRDLIAADHNASAVQFSSQPQKGSARIKKETASSSIISPSARPIGDTTAEQLENAINGDDDDDDEFYDAEGNCLTSYFPSSSASRDAAQLPSTEVASRVVESEEDWELRLLSRQKGREDALFTQVLIADMVAQVQLFNKLEQDQMKLNEYSKLETDVDFYDVAMQMLSKLCMAKPSETLLPDEWCKGWENTMNSASSYSDADISNTVVCGFCSMNESYLLSPFVKAQTLEEWLHDSCNTDTENAALGSAGEGAHGNLSHATVTSSTGIKGFRSTNKLMNGITWEPLCENGSILEIEECKKVQHRTMRAGSMIMHECCANYMHVYRQIAFDKFKQQEEQYVMEIVLGLGRARSTPVGRDRENSLYWIFSGSKYLFVSHSNSGDSIAEFSRKASPELNTESVESSEGSSRWSTYRETAEIGLVILWLNKDIPCERMLLRVLMLLFPNAAAEGLKYLSKLDEQKSSVAAVQETSSSSEGSDSEIQNHMDVSAIANDGVFLLPSFDIDDSEDKCVEMVDAPSSMVVKSENNNHHLDEANFVDTHEEEEDEFDGETMKMSLKRQRLSDSADDIGAISSAGKEDLGRSRRIKRPRFVNDECDLSMSMTRDVLFKQGDHVVVRSPTHGVLWGGQVLETKSVSGSNGCTLYYFIGFSGLSSAYEGWFSDAVVFTTGSNKAGEQLIKNSKLEHFQKKVLDAPDTLKSLHAFKFLHESYRHWGLLAPTLTFGNSRSMVGMLRAGLLIVEAALPFGSVDDSEDKWCDDLVLAWRESVNTAQDATALMQSQIVLECAVKSAWLRPAGVKLMCCLPSRAHAIRNATCGAVAVRLWALDSAIRYDKLQVEQFVEQVQKPKPAVSKGRPPKTEPPVPLRGKRSSQQGQVTAADDFPSETASVASSTAALSKPVRGAGRRR